MLVGIVTQTDPPMLARLLGGNGASTRLEVQRGHFMVLRVGTIESLVATNV